MQIEEFDYNIDEEDTVQMIFEAITKLEKNISHYVSSNDYSKLYSTLHEYTYNLIGTDEEAQLFAARHGYIAILNYLLGKLSAKNILSTDGLKLYFKVCKEIESWNTLSEYFLNLNWFVENIKLFSTSYRTTQNKYVNDAIHLINQNISSKKLTVFWLAKQLNITTTHLNNLFKVELDQTVSKFINNTIIDSIIYELINNGKSLSEVREQFGFTSSSHFSQFFKRNTKLSPLQYLKALK